MIGGQEPLFKVCPMCRRTLTPDAQARGLRNYHVIELVRMASGELPAPHTRP